MPLVIDEADQRYREAPPALDLEFSEVEIDIESDALPDEVIDIFYDDEGNRVTKYADGSIEIGDDPDDEDIADDDGDFDDNLAEQMSEEDLGVIAEELIMGVEGDLASRGKLEEMVSKTIDMLGLSLDSIPQDGGTVSKVHHTLLLESVVRYQSNAGAEMLPAAGPVKVRDDKPTELPHPEEQAKETLRKDIEGMTGQPLPPEPPSGGLMAKLMGMIGGMRPADPAAPGGTAMTEGGLGASMIGHNGGPPLEEEPEEMPIDRNALAEALEEDMNHYLTAVAKEYVPDYYRMLFAQGLMGTAFKKVFHCPVRGRPVSDFISLVDLIVSNDATDINTAGRVTHRTKISQSLMKRMQLLGVYRDVPLTTPSENVSDLEQKVKDTEGVEAGNTTMLDNDADHELYEVYVDYNLPGYKHKDDLPLPYKITIEVENRKIIEIRRDWKEGDATYTRRRTFVKYELIPGLGFYGYGYMHILGNTQKALTAVERELLDAGMFACFPGFLVAKTGTRQTTTDIRVMPGQGAEIDTNGLPIKDSVMELPYKEPSSVLLALAQGLAGDARALAGFLEIPVGEGMANIPVGTIMAMIEQATKVMGAIHKRNHTAHQDELEMLRDLFIEDPESLWKFARSPKRRWQLAAEFADMYLVPASDPNIPSHIHRIMMGMALAQRAKEKPGLYDEREVEERLLRIMGFDDFENLLKKPQADGKGPPPDPQVTQTMIEGKNREAEQMREMAQDQQRGQIKMAEKQMEIADNMQQRAHEQTMEAMKMRNEMLKKAP